MVSLLFALCTWSRVGDAQPSEATARVVVLDAGGDGELEATIAELLARDGLRTARVGEGVSGAVVARVRVDRDRDGARIVVHAASGERAERRVPPAATAALYRETVAHAVLGSVEPLAARALEPAPSAPPESPRRAPPRAVASAHRDAPPSPRSPWSFVVRAEAGGALVGPELPALPVAGALGVERRGALRPTALVGAGYAFAPRVDGPGVDGSLALVPMRARASIEPVGGERLALAVGVHGGVDVATLRVTPTRGSVRALEPSTRAQPILGASLGVRLRVSQTFDLGAALGLDLDLAPRRFSVERGPSRDAVLELARARPFAMLHVTWGPLGFAGRGSPEARP